jgi:hypothetical protein
MRHYTSFFAAGLALVLTIAALNTNVFALPQQQDPASVGDKLCPPLDEKTLNIINENGLGLMTICPNVDLASPENTAHISTSLITGHGTRATKYTFTDSSQNIIYEADVYRSSPMNRIEKINFTKPTVDGTKAPTAMVKFDNSAIRGNIKKLELTGFDGQKRKIEFDYKTFSAKLEKIEIEGANHHKTKLEINYHFVSSKIKEIKLNGNRL